MDNKMRVQKHVQHSIMKCSSYLYGLKIMRSQGFSTINTQHFYKSVIVSRLLYGSPSQWALPVRKTKEGSIKYGYCSREDQNVQSQVATAHQQLFLKIVSNPHHVLHQLLPPKRCYKYSLWPGKHELTISVLRNNAKRGFMDNMLHDLI